MDRLGKNIFKGVILNKVARENPWGATLFWGAVLFSPGFRKLLLVCLVGVIVLMALAAQNPGSNTKSVSSPSVGAQKPIPASELPQLQTTPDVIVSPTTPPDVTAEAAESSEVPQNMASSQSDVGGGPKSDIVASNCEVTKELSASQTCANASVSALTRRYQMLIEAIAAKGQLVAGNYAEDKKVRRLIAECETELCKRETLVYAIDMFKTEVLE